MKELHTLVPSQVNFGINFNSDPQCESLQPFGFSLRKGRGIVGAVPDLGEGPEGPPALILGQNEARRAEQTFF